MILALDRTNELVERIYNVGDESLNLTKRDIVKAITRRAPARVIEADYETDPEMRDYPVSFARIASHGFRATKSLDDGIEEVVKLYRVQPRD